MELSLYLTGSRKSMPVSICLALFEQNSNSQSSRAVYKPVADVCSLIMSCERCDTTPRELSEK